MKNVIIFIGLLNFTYNFGQSTGLEIVDSDKDFNDIEYPRDVEYIDVVDERCDGHESFYSFEDAKSHCSSDPACTSFYSHANYTLEYEYFTCTTESKNYCDEGDSDIYFTYTNYKKKCIDEDAECGLNNICRSGQCYERKENQSCSGEKFFLLPFHNESIPYESLFGAASICSSYGQCRCMQEIHTDYKYEVWLYTSTLEGDITSDSRAWVKIGNYYEGDQPVSGSERSIVESTLVAVLVIFLIKLTN